jgi:hypothetical protein
MLRDAAARPWQAHFSDPEAVMRYAEGPPRFVPGYADLHRMTRILLAERLCDRIRRRSGESQHRARRRRRQFEPAHPGTGRAHPERGRLSRRRDVLRRVYLARLDRLRLKHDRLTSVAKRQMGRERRRPKVQNVWCCVRGPSARDAVPSRRLRYRRNPEHGPAPSPGPKSRRRSALSARQRRELGPRRGAGRSPATTPGASFCAVPPRAAIWRCRPLFPLPLQRTGTASWNARPSIAQVLLVRAELELRRK